MDISGKDTDRLSHSGADAAAITSPSGFAYLERRPVELRDVALYFQSMDLVLIEGCKSGPFPKIALYRKAPGQPLAVPADMCLAIVSDTPLNVPCRIFPLDDPDSMGVFLLERLKEEKGGEPYADHS